MQIYYRIQLVPILLKRRLFPISIYNQLIINYRIILINISSISIEILKMFNYKNTRLHNELTVFNCQFA